MIEIDNLLNHRKSQNLNDKTNKIEIKRGQVGLPETLLFNMNVTAINVI